MGVKNLSSLIKRFSPTAVTQHSFLDSTGSTFAIDAHLLTLKFHFASLDQIHDPHRLARAWFSLLQNLKRHEIEPIVVFDGDSRINAKHKEIKKRRAQRLLTQERAGVEAERLFRLSHLSETWSELEQLDSLERDGILFALRELKLSMNRSTLLSNQAENLILKFQELQIGANEDQQITIYSPRQKILSEMEASFHQAIIQQEPFTEETSAETLESMVTKSNFLEANYRTRSEVVDPIAFSAVLQLIDSMGIPFIKPSIESPHEAEGICSALCHAGRANWVVSEDTDVTVYGSPMIRKISSSSMNVLDPTVLRRELGVTKEQFLDLALLCGTDFTDRIPGLGPVRALELILKYSTIERILSEQTKYRPVDGAAYIATIEVARTIFVDIPPVQNFSIERRPLDPHLDNLLKDWKIWR